MPVAILAGLIVGVSLAFQSALYWYYAYAAMNVRSTSKNRSG